MDYVQPQTEGEAQACGAPEPHARFEACPNVSVIRKQQLSLYLKAL